MLKSASPNFRGARALAMVSLLVALLAAAPAQGIAFGWQGTSAVDNRPLSVGAMRLTVSPAGDEFVVWSAITPSSRMELRSNYRTAAGAWLDDFQRINTTNQSVQQFVVDLSPNCIAEQSVAFASVGNNTSDVGVFFARRDVAATTAWSTVEVGRTNITTIAPAVFCRNDDVTVAWTASDGVRDNLWVNQNRSGVWTGPVLLETSNDAVHDFSAAAYDDGTVVVAWSEDGSNGFFRIASSVYVPGTGWSGAAYLTPDLPYAGQGRPGVAVIPGGPAIVAWVSADGNGAYVSAASWTPSGSWSAAENVAQLGFTLPTDPLLRVDGYGNVRAFWSEPNPTYTIISSSLRAGGIWGYPEGVARIDGPPGVPFSGAVDAFGNAFVTWTATKESVASAGLARSTGGGGWVSTESISPVTDYFAQIRNLQVGASGDGLATFAWVDTGASNDPYAQDDRVIVRHYLGDFSAPDVYVYSVFEGMSTGDPTVVVSGFTERDASVVVSGVLASVDASGFFSVPLALSPGVNLIEVAATDGFGNVNKQWFNVTFDDPVAALQASIDASQAAVANLTASLNNATAAMAQAQANLSAALATLADANATQADLDAANARVAAAEANVTMISLEQGRLQARLDAANGNLTAALARVDALTQDLAVARSDANATRDALAAQNASAQEQRESAARAEAAASSAATFAWVAVALGAAGIIVGVLSAVRGRPPKNAAQGRSPDKPLAP